MYVVRMDKHEYTEDGQKHEVWGYAIYDNVNCVKQEVIKARVDDFDTRVMRYIRCYQWALQRIVSYFSTIEITSDTLNIYLTNYNVMHWLESGDINKLYRLAMSKITEQIDELPHSDVKLCRADRDWGFRKTLREDTLQRTDNYRRLIDIIANWEA